MGPDSSAGSGAPARHVWLGSQLSHSPFFYIYIFTDCVMTGFDPQDWHKCGAFIQNVNMETIGLSF